MIHRLGLIVGSIAAAAILALGFAASGFGLRAAIVDAEQPISAAGISDTAAVAPDPLVTTEPITRVKTTTVYVKPAPKPKVIHVTRRAPTPAKHRPTKVVKVRTTHRGESDDGGGERGDD